MDKQIRLAKKIATEAHKGQKRWDGTPYIKHPEAVAKSLDIPMLKVVAWLHDVLEDTEITGEQLFEKGIDKHLISSILNLTRRPGQNYKDFILQVKNNHIAKEVKIADLKHNMSNLKEGCMKDKYRLALYILEK